jgi:hypothetical protein
MFVAAGWYRNRSPPGIGYALAHDYPRLFVISERLAFRPWSADDFELAWGLWGDPEVTGKAGLPVFAP